MKNLSCFRRLKAGWLIWLAVFNFAGLLASQSTCVGASGDSWGTAANWSLASVHSRSEALMKLIYEKGIYVMLARQNAAG